MGWAMAARCSAVIQPCLKAISSRQATLRPCRFSMTSMKVEARDDALWVVNHKIQQGTLKWPVNNNDMNPKPESHGIQQ